VLTYDHIYVACLWTIFCVSALSFPALFFFTAPYGRHAVPGKAAAMPYNLGWFVMEIPPLTIMPLVFFQGQYCMEPAPLVLFGIWVVHYTYRSLLFPFLLQGQGKTKPVAAVAIGFLFNAINGFAVAYGLSHIGAQFTREWLRGPRFLLGVLLMGAGFAICYHSDAVLRHLRKPGERGYKIPYGGFYRWVSSPNYLGEIIEWTGFAVATWNLPGLAFMVFTIANLFPRAFSHHRWYLEHFPEYPKNRKAIVPFIA
jgi:3-oxo-5-alpha-steroid 4-dehydrogenase 1